MSHLSAYELECLHQVADEVFETFGERGHHIGKALDLDPSFRTGRGPQSALTRQMVVDAVKRGARRARVGCTTGRGGVTELHTSSGTRENIFRVRSARGPEAGTYIIEAKDDSILRDLEAGPLLVQDRWVLAFTRTDYGIGDFFIAPVVDVLEGSPGRLVLGPITHLGTGSNSTSPTEGFRPRDEELDGFGDAEEGPDALPGTA